jgi:hypothetical protein
MTLVRPTFCRVAHPEEFVDGRYLSPDLAVTAEVLEGQHPIRAWEYSQALRAFDTWVRLPEPWDFAPAGYVVADVGGAGSAFWKGLLPHSSHISGIDRIDPTFPTASDGVPEDVQALPTVRNLPVSLAGWQKQHQEHYHAVFCVSVLEHVPPAHVEEFLAHLRNLVCPGGLLVLTCDLARSPIDDYHFHWMRHWIPTPEFCAASLLKFAAGKFVPLGALPDFTYHGVTVYDYSVASFAFVRTL